MQKILVVEDDFDIQDILKNHLIDAGYEVAVASDGVTGITMFDDTIDLVLLDIMLPKIDGYGVCEVIRKRSQVPVIMLTALSDEENQLRGFEQQIDDYIPKPFSPQILLCKIAAILRRRTAENQNQSQLTYKELSMDIDGFHVYQSGNEVVLTSKEFALLRIMLENQGKVFTRQMLLDRLWSEDLEVEERIVDSHIKNIRKKLNADYIKTIRGWDTELTKYIKQRLSVKIFIITFLLLGAACSGTYFFISKLLSATYSNLINVSTEKAAMHLVEQMTSFDNISDCENDISDFSKETNAVFWIEDSNGRMIYPDETSMETFTTSADDTVTFDEDESFMDMQPSGATTTNFYPFTLKNGTAYTLAVQTDLFVVQQATKVLLSILPYVILMVFLLSLLCAWLYARYITRPIVRLSKISKQMAELDFSGQCSTGREDELGCLAQNLNSLSASLSTALNDLQTANQQLKTDIEKEQELERQRVDFFSAASHELKTPLTILKGHLAGMLNGVSGYENHIEYMERSLAVVDRMEKLVKELLYVAKAEETQKSEYKTIDFAEIFRVQIATVTDLLEEKKQRLEANIPTHLYCEVGQAQMERAIQNILVNAIRYSPSGELIRISLSEMDGTIRGEIENTGVQVSDDAIPHLFEAFYRTDASRNCNTGGTGLGLHIVRKVMEMHRAKYGISNTSKGVLFWFELFCKQSIDNSI